MLKRMLLTGIICAAIVMTIDFSTIGVEAAPTCSCTSFTQCGDQGCDLVETDYCNILQGGGCPTIYCYTFGGQLLQTIKCGK